MKDLSTAEDYRAYYGSLEMQQDLLRWFDVEPGYGTHYLWVKFPNQKNGRRRNHFTYTLQSSTRQKSFYFSFCIYFLVLQSQAIHLLGGEEARDRYHRETGVPYFSCGLGGAMHPIHTIYESGLAPCEAEIKCYRSMLETIMSEIKGQVAELDKYVPAQKLYRFILKEIHKFIKVLNFQNYLERCPGYMIKHVPSTGEHVYNVDGWDFD